VVCPSRGGGARGDPRSPETQDCRQDYNQLRPRVADRPAIAMYRLVIEEYLALGRLRESIAAQAETALANHPIGGGS
jgi:hypothetical protein